MTKVLITGTHFTPAQAIIEELNLIKPGPSRSKKWSIVYVGRQSTREGDSSKSVESQLLPNLGVKFYHLSAGRLQRKFTIYTIPSLFKVPIGFIQAMAILLKERPNVVLSFGGYVAVPVVVNAWLLNIPILVHEQTLVSGLANKICSLFATKLAHSFDKTNKTNKYVLTGNPLRNKILNPQSMSEEYSKFFSLAKKLNKPVILVTGGNQGSHIINQTIEDICDQLTNLCFVIHQTGDSKFQDFERLSKKQVRLKHPDNYLVKKWIEVADLGSILSEIKLVVSRAGINTLLELAYFEVPTIVIPLPHLYQDEQNKNAQFFNKIGLVQVLPQSKLTGNKLFQIIEQTLKNINQYKAQAKGARELVVPDSAKRLVLELELLT